jgi:hypothetical protein
VATAKLTREKGGNGAPTDSVEGEQSQVHGGGQLASEEGGEAFGEVGSA